jgi:protein-S-isoprenylcysteine O-methyltransferase Ste14
MLMIFLRGLAALVLFVEMPVPLFWLVLHPRTAYWRGRLRAAFATGVIVAWGIGGAFLVSFRATIFRRNPPFVWAIAAGLLLVAFDFYIFRVAHRNLGTARIVGKTELDGGGELARTGIYARMRHPRYTGMFAAVAGACFLAGTLRMWLVVAGWLPLAMTAILLEEREMRRRFGPAFDEYRRRVPRFLPLRFRAREG